MTLWLDWYVLWNRVFNDCHSFPSIFDGIRKCLFLVEFSLAHPSSQRTALEYMLTASHELEKEILHFRAQHNHFIRRSTANHECIEGLLRLARTIRQDAYKGTVFDKFDPFEEIRVAVNKAYIDLDTILAYFYQSQESNSKEPFVSCSDQRSSEESQKTLFGLKYGVALENKEILHEVPKQDDADAKPFSEPLPFDTHQPTPAPQCQQNEISSQLSNLALSTPRLSIVTGLPYEGLNAHSNEACDNENSFTSGNTIEVSNQDFHIQHLSPPQTPPVWWKSLQTTPREYYGELHHSNGVNETHHPCIGSHELSEATVKLHSNHQRRDCVPKQSGTRSLTSPHNMKSLEAELFLKAFSTCPEAFRAWDFFAAPIDENSTSLFHMDIRNSVLRGGSSINADNSGSPDKLQSAHQEQRASSVEARIFNLLHIPCKSAAEEKWPTSLIVEDENFKSFEARLQAAQRETLKNSRDWKGKFISSRGNEYFCDIDEEYLTDRFNLTNLNTEVQYYQYALDLVTDVFDLDCDEEMREQIEKSARHLYGLVHARYIVTTRGLQKMVEKYKKGDFGKCPRVACEGQPLLPMGQHDVANTSPVKLFCARCEDLYNPKSSRHASIDGAYFGTSFHGILFQVYPQLMPPKSQKRHEPRIYGFRVHAAAALARWQEEKRDEMKLRLAQEGLDTGFEREDEEEMEDGDSQRDEDAQNEGIDDMFEGPRVMH